MTAVRQCDRRFPAPKGVFSQVLSKLGILPALAVVGGDLDRADSAAPVESDAMQGDLLAGLHVRSVLQRGDEAAHIVTPDRPCFVLRRSGGHAGARIIWDPVGGRHPDILE